MLTRNELIDSRNDLLSQSGELEQLSQTIISFNLRHPGTLRRALDEIANTLTKNNRQITAIDQQLQADRMERFQGPLQTEYTIQEFAKGYQTTPKRVRRWMQLGWLHGEITPGDGKITETQRIEMETAHGIPDSGTTSPPYPE
jgi:hypothetical protein